MEKYKRYREELADDEAIQEFLNKITSEGWEIIHYYEKPFGGMGIMEVTAVCKKRQEIL